jgi:hypothetical protein
MKEQRFNKCKVKITITEEIPVNDIFDYEIDEIDNMEEEDAEEYMDEQIKGDVPLRNPVVRCEFKYK